MEFKQGTLFNEIYSDLFLCFSYIYSTVQLIFNLLLLLSSTKPTLETPHYSLHYAHRHTHSPVPTPNTAIENDIDMMVICTCSKKSDSSPPPPVMAKALFHLLDASSYLYFPLCTPLCALFIAPLHRPQSTRVKRTRQR